MKRTATLWATVCGMTILTLAAVWACGPAQAEEKPTAPAEKPAAEQPGKDAPPPPPKPAADAKEIESLIVQLDDDQFSRRQEASQRLQATGKAAIPALGEGAKSTKPEVNARCMELLRTHIDSEDEACRNSAKEALEKLAGGEGPAAAEAKKILDARRPRGMPGGINIQGGNVVIGLAGAGARKMSVKNVNGVKEIEAEEDGRKVKINDDPNKGIVVEWTEKKDGKEKTTKEEAKTAAELEKKSAEAYKIYKQYANQNAGVMQIGNVGGINVQPRVNIAQMRIQSICRQLDALANDPQVENVPAASRDELIKSMEKARTQMAEVEKKLKAQAEKEAKDKAAKDGKGGEDPNAPKDKPADKLAPKDFNKAPDGKQVGEVKLQANEIKLEAAGGAAATIQVGGDGAIEVKVEIQEQK